MYSKDNFIAILILKKRNIKLQIITQRFDKVLVLFNKNYSKEGNNENSI
jgi:hypothetical protein